MSKMSIAILAILLGASATVIHAAPVEAPKIMPPVTTSTRTLEPAPTEAANQSPALPPVISLQPPVSIHPAPCGANKPPHPQTSCLHRLIEWATYCPKNRLGCCSSCGPCFYRGAPPLYLFMMNTCAEGNGQHPTMAPTCCGKGKPCRSCAGAANRCTKCKQGKPCVACAPGDCK